jgi:hypothetical protein
MSRKAKREETVGCGTEAMLGNYRILMDTSPIAARYSCTSTRLLPIVDDVGDNSSITGMSDTGHSDVFRREYHDLSARSFKSLGFELGQRSMSRQNVS